MGLATSALWKPILHVESGGMVVAGPAQIGRRAYRSVNPHRNQRAEVTCVLRMLAQHSLIHLFCAFLHQRHGRPAQPR